MNKTFRSRMGTVMRRTSSLVAISRPASPARSSSDAASNSSLQQLDTALAPPAGPEAHAPTPIAESPAREAAALAPDPTGPSRLAESITADSIPAVEAPAAASPTAAGPQAPAPGAFTDEPEDASGSVASSRPSVEVQKENVSAPREVPQPEPQPPAQEDRSISRAPQPPPLSVADGASSYFDNPVPQTVVPPELQAPIPFQEVVADNTLGGGTGASTQTTPRPLGTWESNREQPLTLKDSNVSLNDQAKYSGQLPSYLQDNPAAQVSAKPSKASLAPSAPGTGADQTRYLAPSIGQGNGTVSHGQSKASSIRLVSSEPSYSLVSDPAPHPLRMPIEDPFADPHPRNVPAISVAPVHAIHMPQYVAHLT